MIGIKSKPGLVSTGDQWRKIPSVIWMLASGRIVMAPHVGKRIELIAGTVPFFMNVQTENSVRTRRVFGRKSGKISR